eukprot:c9977_g1_i1.p1 GENE.c9977_g1_i1~~c9977_g1_i1.p1  ORF type:complete len:413 (+),score=92.56 c9977_g1_i1:2-1240(+)
MGKSHTNEQMSTTTKIVHTLPFPVTEEGISVSVLSFNILAGCFALRNPNYYPYCLPDQLSWEARSSSIIEKLCGCGCDIICLQEVEFQVFEDELAPFLASLGYNGVMQDCQTRKESQETGNATFFKSDKFALVWSEHRSRTLVVGLSITDTNTNTNANTTNNNTTNTNDTTTQLQQADHNQNVIAVGNCHLEGHPSLSKERLGQMQSMLRHMEKHPLKTLIICGDFNCNEESNVCQYLAFPAPHWTLKTTFDLELQGKVFGPTYANTGFSGRLDHMWFDANHLSHHSTLDVVTENDAILHDVLLGRLPGPNWPSDHLMIASQFLFHSSSTSARRASQSESETTQNVPESLSETEMQQWNILESTKPPKKYAGKPTPEEIEARRNHKQEEKAFLETLSKGKQLFLKQKMKDNS